VQTNLNEYLTIIGDSLDEVVAESRILGLTDKNYSIVHPIHLHQLKGAGGDSMALSDRRCFVATFALVARVGAARS